MTKSELVFISGKISDTNDYQERFQAAEWHLVNNGYNVINPVKLEHNHDKSWKSYMRECIAALMRCDTIYILSDWQDSFGAIEEVRLAKLFGIRLIYQNEQWIA